MLILCLVGTLHIFDAKAQDNPETCELTVITVDKETKSPLEFAHVILSGMEKRSGKLSDEKGKAKFTGLVPGDYKLRISYIGKELHEEKIRVNRYKTVLTIEIVNSSITLNDAYILGKESRGMTSSTNIGRKAISHIQPSSFADILELLPGNMAHDPHLAVPNIIALREVGRPGGGYNTSSLGTQFIVDGRPLMTDAEMQSIPGWQGYIENKNIVNCGVDMRTIPTDEIDSVEIVRGIPSVEYGDLTSGLIKIHRRKGGNRISGRFKSDMTSKLYHIGKGFEFPERKVKLNAGIEYLDYKTTPITDMYKYNRLTSSLRGEKIWLLEKHTLTLNAHIDYTGSFDKVVDDREANLGFVNEVRNKYNKIGFLAEIDLKSRKAYSIFEGIRFTLSGESENDEISRHYMFRPPASNPQIPVVDAITPGTHEAFLPIDKNYIIDMAVDGKPLYFYTKAVLRLRIPIWITTNKIMAGIDGRYSKNRGKGNTYDDPLKPPYTGYRPYPFKDRPATKNAGLFVEDNISVPIASHLIRINAGIRADMSLNIPANYDLHNKVHFDPRINIQWRLPEFPIGTDNIGITFTGSAGRHTKMPTLSHLFMQPAYIDIWEYYPKHYRTYIEDPVNYGIRPASNTKREIRADVEYKGFFLSVTGYGEDMTSGIRPINRYKTYEFDYYSLPKSPQKQAELRQKYGGMPGDIPLFELTMERDTMFETYGSYENGSRTYKKGVEYTFFTPRLRNIATRITINGAWLYTRYSNSYASWEKPTKFGGGGEYRVIGLYENNESYVRWVSRTNFTFDTYAPRIGFTFSTSVQFQWTRSHYTGPWSESPLRFKMVDGTEGDYNTANGEKYPVIKSLRRDQKALADYRDSEKWFMNVNLKASKKFYRDRITLALFVNRLLDAYPTERTDEFIRKRFVNPYFGMEINFNI